MRLQLISDLHFEFMLTSQWLVEIEKISAKQKTAEKADCLVIAGDMCGCKNIALILNEFAKHYTHIIYVNGNHELYGHHIDQVRAQKQYISENVHWLDNSKVILPDSDREVEFVGCTLWFPNKRGLEGLTYGWSDFTHISNFREYVYKENAESQKFLNENVTSSSIVVTHYLPTKQSIHPKFLARPYSDYNGFFVCDMEDLIRSKKPRYFLSGHTHEKFDYWFDGIEGGTKIITNPKGYLGEITEKPFDYWKMIEI